MLDVPRDVVRDLHRNGEDRRGADVAALRRQGAQPRRQLAKTEEAAANGAKLIVFPELSLTAYKYLQTAEGLLYAEPVPGPSTEAMAAKAAELGVYVVFGLLETDGESLFDGVVLVGPEGYIGTYAKWTISSRSEALTFTRGWETPPVFETAIGRIGIASCYDGAFPEVTRLLGLQGAQIMVLIDTENGTTWRDYVRSRAVENGACAVVANRVGGERLSTFNGYSLIAAPSFDLLANASTTDEETIYATVDLGALGPSLVAERRPELYGALSEPLPAQILSVDVEPTSNVTGQATAVAVTAVTASIPSGTPVVTRLIGPDGKTYARAVKKLGVDRIRVALDVPAAAPPGTYTSRSRSDERARTSRRTRTRSRTCRSPACWPCFPRGRARRAPARST